MSNPDPTATCLVPLGIKALTITPKLAGQGYDTRPMNYAELNNFLSPVPAVNAEAGVNGDVGVHVTWTLPLALTRSRPVDLTQGSPSETEFPLVPNRWLVVRLPQDGGTDTGEPPANSAAWVILSDTLTATEGAGNFINPAATPATGDVVVPANIGSTQSLSDWVAANAPDRAKQFLAAVGPGDITFSEFAGGAPGVFSMIDPLDGIDSGTFAYAVVGWYSDPTVDPLALHTDWAEVTDPTLLGKLGLEDAAILNERLGWAVAGDDPTAAPTRSLYHAMIYSVVWNANEAPPLPTNYPSTAAEVSEQVKVAVGATSVDALSALVGHALPAVLEDKAGLDAETAQRDADVVALMIEAAQYSALAGLAEPGGLQKLESRAHRAAFGAQGGSIRWELVPVLGSTAAAPTEAQASWLIQLNQTESVFEREAAILGSMQWQLYALWWEAQAIVAPQTPQTLINNATQALFDNAKTQFAATPGAVADYSDTVSDQMCLVSGIAAGLPIGATPSTTGDPDASDQDKRIAAFAQTMPDPGSYTIKPVPQARYWQPQDPVVLIAGAGSLTSFQPKLLTCRTLAEVAAAVGADTQTALVSSEAAAALPEGVALMVSDAARLLPSAVAEEDADAAPMPLALVKWKQPWVPLYLDWKVEYLFTYQFESSSSTYGYFTRQEPDYQFAFDYADWAFDGKDYVWAGNDLVADQSGTLSSQHVKPYSGRTYVTPQATRTFSSTLAAWEETHPGSLDPSVIAQVQEWQVLSQTLSGLTSLLVMRDMGNNVPPSDGLEPLIGRQPEGVPYPQAFPDQSLAYHGGVPYFFPLRGGMMQLSTLRLTDSFGRICDLTNANGVSPSSGNKQLVPILSRGMQPPSDTAAVSDGLISLPPRIVQPSRLAVRFVSANDDTVETGYGADDNPVCGWLLANHLDQAISVYDQAGNALGEIGTLVTGIADGVEQRQVVWTWAPGGSVAPQDLSGSAPTGLNTHLQGVVDSVIIDDNGAAFFALLSTIDETAWTIDPLGGREDQGLSTLIGYPIAVVRANMQLQLKGLAYTNQAYIDLFKPGSDELLENTGSLLEVPFPVRLGGEELRSDGLIGYYMGSDYSTLNAVHVSSEVLADDTGYVRKIGAPLPDEGGPNYVNLHPVPATSHQTDYVFDTTQSQNLTLLVDPRASLHATTGLLPVKRSEIPDRFVSPALKTMALSISVGPVLLEPEAVQIPLPSEQNGRWQWISASDPTTWASDPVVSASDRARLDRAAPNMVQGWLQLTPNPDVPTGE
ncbi:hypothetical protein [Gymnodinialimonas sp.]